MGVIYDLAKRTREAIAIVIENVPDEIALKATTLYEKWQDEEEYKMGDRIVHDGILYKVLQEHTSQEDWTPDKTPSLFTKVLIPDANIIPEWEQPDSTNPYMTGDKVTHNGNTWVSTCDNNTWEPGIYGWEMA